MLNNLFFGYLELKLRRFTRIVLVPVFWWYYLCLYPRWPLYPNELFKWYLNDFQDCVLNSYACPSIFYACSSLIIIPLISYILKPVIVRDYILNTLYFGYLQLKWRRLTRFVLAVSLVGSLMYFYAWGGSEVLFLFFKPSRVVFMWSPLILIFLISYLLKPFIVKDDAS